MNKNLSEKLIRKNKWYVNTLSSVSAEKNSKLDKIIIQINISTKARIPKTNELLYEIVRMDKNLKVEDVYNRKIIYDINLEYIKEESYNERITNKKREIAKKMSSKGLDVNEIVEITGLIKEEIKKMR